MRALVVEDSDMMRHLLAEELGDRGHAVVPCADAETAWVAYQQEMFPLVVADWLLPGMDGLELCRRIRTLPEGDQSVILIVTAQDQPEHLVEVLDAGASDYLPKPFTPNLLQVRLAIAERQATEIAARKAAEVALIEARAAAAEVAAWRELSRQQRLMIHVIAHELKTPLTSIFGFSELLLELEPLSDRLRSQLGAIHAGATRLHDLVNNIVELSQLETHETLTERQPFDLAKHLPTWVSELAQPPRVVVTVAADLPLVTIDVERWHQLVHQLVKNALTFSPPNTPVTVWLRALGSDMVALDVADQGPGIPPERLSHVFEPFFRTDLAHDRAVQGIGVGLTLVRRIVELHGGEVYVVSTLGEGSTFTIMVPTAADTKIKHYPEDGPEESSWVYEL